MGVNLLNMNVEHNHGCNTRQVVPGIKTNSQIFRNLKDVFADCSIEKFNAIQKVNLTNYYRHDRQKKITCCLLCKSNFNDNATFEHTISLPHEVNKRFYNFVQKRNQTGDINFIIYNPEWVECRYCDNGLIANDYSQRNRHIQEMIHIQRREYCFRRVERECKNQQRSARTQQPDYPLQETGKYIRSPFVRENPVKNSRANNEHPPVIRPSRVVNEMKKESPLQKPSDQSQAHRYETQASGANYYQRTHKTDPYKGNYHIHSGFTRPRPKDEDKGFPTWVWIGICCFIAYWWCRRSH